LRAAEEESVESQLAFLDRKDLSNLNGHEYKDPTATGQYGLPDQICNKDWSRINDPNWGVIVVSGHNKYAYKEAQDFVESHRIGFHSFVDLDTQIYKNTSLHCGILPRRVECIEDYSQIEYFKIKSKAKKQPTHNWW